MICDKHPELNGERYADGSCAECRREATRRYRAKNAERLRAQDRQKYEQNRDVEIARRQAYYAANVEQRREYGRKYGRKYYAAHKPERLEYQRQWNSENRSRKRAIAAKRRARKISATPGLTAIERARVQELYDIASARYAQTGERWHVDHDLPLARGGQHHPDNMVLLPASMNWAKRHNYSSTFEFLIS